MELSSADFQSSHLQTGFASNAVRENSHARQQIHTNAEKIAEQKTLEAVVQKQEQYQSALIPKTDSAGRGEILGGKTRDGAGHAHSETEHTRLTEEDLLKESSQKSERKALFFDSSGRTGLLKGNSSIVDVLG